MGDWQKDRVIRNQADEIHIKTARIAELEADRDKWRNECLAANESERKLFERQADLEAEVERLRGQANGWRREVRRLEGAETSLLFRIDGDVKKAHNGALDDAIHACRYDDAHDCREAIRALKR